MVPGWDCCCFATLASVTVVLRNGGSWAGLGDMVFSLPAVTGPGGRQASLQTPRVPVTVWLGTKVRSFLLPSGVVSTVVPDSAHKLFIGGLPNYLNDDQVGLSLPTPPHLCPNQS